MKSLKLIHHTSLGSLGIFVLVQNVPDVLAWIPTGADVSNKILSKVIILGHPAWEEVSQLQNL